MSDNRFTNWTLITAQPDSDIVMFINVTDKNIFLYQEKLLVS